MFFVVDSRVEDTMQGSFSTKDAADQLGVTPQHLRRLIESGQLSAERVGRHYVVDAASLEALRAAREAVAQIPPDAFVQITYLRNMLAQIPWAAIQRAQQIIQQFESSGLADAAHAAQHADAATASALPARPRWQQWASSDDPRDAVEKLAARARQRTHGMASGNSTDMLRAMREGRHADGRRGMHIAQQIAQQQSSDTQYLALAERLGAEYWTDDR